MALETLILDPHYTITRQILLPGTARPTGGGAVSAHRRSSRVTYQFTVSDRQRVQADAEYLYNFVQRHQGDIPFWWDAQDWGQPSTPLIVGFGDGVRVTFALPNRYLTAPAIVYVDDVLLTPQPACDLVRGIVTLASAPAEDAVVTAGYQCVYKMVVWASDEALMSEQAFYKRLFSVEGLTFHEFIDSSETSEMVQDYYTVTWNFDPVGGLFIIYDTEFAH